MSTDETEADAPRPEPKLRLFIAAPLPEAAEAALLDAQSALRRRASRSRLEPRWTKPEQLHVTFKFLGYASSELRLRIDDALTAEAEISHPIETSYAALGAFPSARRARVVIAHLADARGELTALFARLEAALESLGFPLETRAFAPHVTLARLKTPGDVERLLPAASLLSEPFRLDRLRLYRSILKPTGAEYHVLTEARLGP